MIELESIVSTSISAISSLSSSSTHLANSSNSKMDQKQLSNLVSSEWLKEKEVLYSQLDEKDDEINNQSQTIEKYFLQIQEQEELINQLRRENDDLQNRISALEIDNESQKEEVKEVLKALEELAMNFDQKQQEAEIKGKENENLSYELDKRLNNLKSIEEELETLKEVASSQRKRMLDIMMLLVKDLFEIGNIIGIDSNSIQNVQHFNIENIEEDFTMSRLFVSKLKGEIKLLVNKCNHLDEQKNDSEKLFEQKSNEIEDLRLSLIQNEARLKSQQEFSKEIDAKKRKLEEELDTTREELAKLKALSGGNNEQMIHKSLNDQLETHVEQLKKQLKELRNENNEIQENFLKLQDEYQNFKIAYEKLQSDYEKLKREESERVLKLNELQTQQELREQAKQDLKGLEETVAKELQSLHNLRKLFVQDLQARLKKTNKNLINTSISEQDEEEIGSLNTGSTIAQKQKIAFLENNLEQLTKVHKQLVRDNADLRCELPKLEKRLKATMERVKSLEVALKEAKEGAMKDRKRYQNEVERIKEAVRQRSMIKKGNIPNIVKPIRAGQQPIIISSNLNSTTMSKNE